MVVFQPRVSSRAEERLASPPALAPQQMRQPRAAEEGRKREDERLLQERVGHWDHGHSPVPLGMLAALSDEGLFHVCDD